MESMISKLTKQVSLLGSVKIRLNLQWARFNDGGIEWAENAIKHQSAF